MTQRASWWSITINNPTDADRSSLQSANWPSWVKSYSGQEEVGRDGTLHIQGALNTAQVRFAAIKGWLTRAHIEIARDKSALLKYVEKSDTAVAGTFKSESKEYLTMDKALKRLVQYYEPADEQAWELANQDIVKVYTDEYWRAVNKLLTDDTTLVQLYTNPQMLRAWVNTKNVWLKYKTNNETPSRPEGASEGQHESADGGKAPCPVIGSGEGTGEEDDKGFSGDEVQYSRQLEC